VGNYPAWRKSTRSGTQEGDCVEVANLSSLSGNVGVRDSKDPEGPRLIFDAADWGAFTRRVKSSDYDLN
jgi:hypothetical protein